MKTKAKFKNPVKKSSSICGLVLNRPKNLLARKNNEGLLTILNLTDDRQFYSIDGIAAEFWLAVNGKASVSKISESLIKKYKPPLKRFQKDVAQFIIVLKRNGLVE
jgi:hypothetical protein